MYVITITDTDGCDQIFVVRADIHADVAMKEAIDAFEDLRREGHELAPIDWASGIMVRRAIVL